MNIKEADASMQDMIDKIEAMIVMAIIKSYVDCEGETFWMENTTAIDRILLLMNADPDNLAAAESFSISSY